MEEMTKAKFFHRIRDIALCVEKISGKPTDDQIIAIAKKHGVTEGESYIIGSAIGSAIYTAWTHPNNAPDIMAAFEGAWEEYTALMSAECDVARAVA